MNETQQKVYDLVRNMYKHEDGTPILLSPTQTEIFSTVSMRLHPRVHCSTHTRYGKSLTVALAVLTRLATFPEKWAITAGNKEKAKIIMNYVNSHIFDHEYIASKFRMEKGDSAESIRRHRNKSHLTFDLGGGKYSELIISGAKDAIGFGAPNVIEDEASLIPDDDHALIMRMLGDDAEDNFLFKIGNPFFRNHFLKSSMDPAYHKIIVDCYKGAEEGRISHALIEEMRKYSFFNVLYEVKFPRAEDVDDKGWMYLLTEEDIKRATDRWATTVQTGRRRIGNDIARGGRNFNVWAMRGDNYATILLKNHEADLMKVAGTGKAFMEEKYVHQEDFALDDVGVGGGVTDKLRELGLNDIIPVKEGATATEKTVKFNPKTRKEEEMPEYANMRAQLYAGRRGLQYWVKHVGALDPAIDWSELTRIRYKKNGSGLIMIESKDDMRKRGEESPDVADGLALTFTEPEAQKKVFNVPEAVGSLLQSQQDRWKL
jgi:hypothetical protein